MSVKAEYVQKGGNIDYKAPRDIEYHEIVPFASCIGVAMENIPEGETGTVVLTGVFEMPAATGLSIETGEAVFWNNTAECVDKGKTGVPAGIAIADKAASGTTALIRLSPAPIAASS